MIVIGITGASGIVLSIKLIEALNNLKIKYCAIMSNAGRCVLEEETNIKYEEFLNLAKDVYDVSELKADIASGSNNFEKMIIIPCSMKTLSAIACGYADNLITRAADVAIKENRKLIIVPRESPLNSIHLENMLKLSKANVIVAPAMFTFYQKPSNIDDLISNFIGRLLFLMEINSYHKKWKYDKI